EEVAHHAGRAEEHLGVDPVDVLLLETWLAAEVSLVRGREGDARPADVLVLASGRGVDADRRRRGVGGERAGLAAFAIRDDARDLVVELLRHVGPPDVGRLEHVGVGRDQLVVTRHAYVLRRGDNRGERTFVSRGCRILVVSGPTQRFGQSGWVQAGSLMNA